MLKLATAGLETRDPAPWDSHRLWDLWEIMETFSVGYILHLVHDLICHTSFGTDDNAPMRPGPRAAAKAAFERLLVECETVGLIVAPQKIQNALDILNLPPNPMETGMMARAAHDIISTIKMEMNGRIFFSLTPEKKRFYEPKEPLFGTDFRTKFSSAEFELDEAGKCIALGRSTAAVFHFMRIMEIGVRATARCLLIPDPLKPSERNWGHILGEIKKGIDAKWPTQSSRHGGDGALFEELYASLDAVRNPWRNATMHIENKYTGEEAEHIFVAVRGFMKKLVSRMDENGKPLA